MPELIPFRDKIDKIVYYFQKLAEPRNPFRARRGVSMQAPRAARRYAGGIRACARPSDTEGRARA
jgi:hypothetical protein